MSFLPSSSELPTDLPERDMNEADEAHSNSIPPPPPPEERVMKDET